jgi:Protein of unknown function (DUF3106)
MQAPARRGQAAAQPALPASRALAVPGAVLDTALNAMLRKALLPIFVAGSVVCLAAAFPAHAADRTPWSRLTPAQQQALDPLQADWAALEPERQAKWLEVAARFPTMNSAERQRLHERMAEWARLTPAQRRTARLQFQEARRVSPEDRQAAWKAYQALPEDQRLRLAQQARPALKPALPGQPVPAGKPATAPAPKAKVNVVQSGSPARKPAVAAALQQARPGATTSPMNKSSPPPASIQHGLPKIAATPGFVDPTTLLPRRGPQGAAAVRSEPATAAASSAAS